MSDKIRFNFEALDDMAKQCYQVQQQLLELVSQSGKWAQQMQGGALQGPPGDKFVEALGIFSKKVQQLADHFGEVVGDLNTAKYDMQAADSNTSKNF